MKRTAAHLQRRVRHLRLVGEIERLDLNGSTVSLLGRREIRGRSSVAVGEALEHRMGKALVDSLPDPT
jgi:hypothetical protein